MCCDFRPYEHTVEEKEKKKKKKKTSYVTYNKQSIVGTATYYLH
jgi:hypothetical protein